MAFPPNSTQLMVEMQIEQARQELEKAKSHEWDFRRELMEMVEKSKRLVAMDPGHSHPVVGYPVAQAQAAPVRYSSREKLFMRMGWAKGSNAPLKFELLEDDGSVYLFFVHDGQHAVIKDSAELFPSDTLVTQLRMVLA